MSKDKDNYFQHRLMDFIKLVSKDLKVSESQESKEYRI